MQADDSLPMSPTPLDGSGNRHLFELRGQGIGPGGRRGGAVGFPFSSAGSLHRRHTDDVCTSLDLQNCRPGSIPVVQAQTRRGSEGDHGAFGSALTAEDEEGEYVFASNGTLEETFARQDDGFEKATASMAGEEALLAPQLRWGMGSSVWGRQGQGNLEGTGDPRDVKAVRAGLPPVDPVGSLIQQASDLVRS